MLRWKGFVVVSAVVAASAVGHAQQSGAAASALTPLDYFQIQQLYAKFCHGLDSAADNGYLFAGVFTADGSYTDAVGTTIQGREPLAALARQNPDGEKGPTHVAHYTTNVLITPTGTGAAGRGYLVLTSPTVVGRGANPAGGGGGGRGGIADAGIFQDEIVKTADGWRIQKRVLLSASR